MFGLLPVAVFTVELETLGSHLNHSANSQLASGGCFGMDQPLAFQLLEGKEEGLDSLEGIAMELEDSLYPLLREVRKSLELAHPVPCPHLH